MTRWLAALLACVLTSPLAAVAADGLRSPSRESSGRRASARKGPIEIWLQLKSTRIRVGEKPRFKLGLKNIGRSTISVPDGLLKHVENLGEASKQRLLVFILVQGPSGGSVAPFPFYPGGPDTCIETSTGPPPGRPSTKDDPYWTPGIDDHEYDLYSFRKLPPGGTLETPPWARSKWRGCAETPGVSPDQFAELWPFDFDAPGRYRIRAVYDLTPQLRSEQGRKREQREVRVETDWIEVDVK